VSAPRSAVAAVAAFLATGISLDPAVRSAPETPAPRAPQRERELPAHELGRPTGAATADLRLEIRPDGHGAHLVSVRRPGFLVSLRDERARSAGADWTALRVALEGEAVTTGRLVWETTPLEGPIETTRGFVHLTGAGEKLSGEIVETSPPEVATLWNGPHARCFAYHDGFGGFSVLCRLPKTVRVRGVANLTGRSALDDAWLMPSGLARFDLARSPSGAEGRVIGLIEGVTAIALSLEARFPVKDEPSLMLHESSRRQPVAAF
jgi:hypothetical protein